MGSFGIPDLTRDYDVDWSFLPGEFESPDRKKLKRITLRDASGRTREVVIEEGLNPRVIPPPGGKQPEPSDDPGVVKPPATSEDTVREQDSFGDMLKTALHRSGISALGGLSKEISQKYNIARLAEMAPTVPGVSTAVDALRGAGALIGAPFAYIGAGLDNPDADLTDMTGVLEGMRAGGEALPKNITPLDLLGGVPGKVGAVAGAADALLGIGDIGEGVRTGDPSAMAMGTVRALGGTAGALNPGRMPDLGVMDELRGLAPDVDRIARGMGYRDAPMAASFMAEPPMRPVGSINVDDTVEVFRAGDGSFFTTNRERAASYPGPMTSVRVPRAVFEAGQPEAMKLGQPTPQDTVLPDEWVRQAVEVEKPDISLPVEDIGVGEREALLSELGVTEAAAPARPPRFNTPEEEGAYLMDILNSDRPASEKMMAQLRLEEITNPDLPSAEAVDQLNVSDLPGILAEEGGPPPVRETVRPANVTPPEGMEVKKVPTAGEGAVKNLNDVIDTMFGKGARVKAAQVKEAREVYEALTKTAKGETPTSSELQAILEKRKAPVEAAPEVPPKAPRPSEEFTKDFQAQYKELSALKVKKEKGSLTPEEEARLTWLDKRADVLSERWFEAAHAEEQARRAKLPPEEQARLKKLDMEGRTLSDAALERKLEEETRPRPHLVQKEKPLSEMTPEEMEAEAVAAEGRMREGKPAPDFERASTLRRLAEQKRTKAARDAQIEANRQASAAATKATPEPPAKPAAKPPEVEVAGPVKPISEAYPEPIGPKRPRGRPPKPVVENPLESKIPKTVRPERVNPVEVFTGEKAEPPPVEPVKKGPVKKAQTDVDTVTQTVKEETGVSPDKPPTDLNTPEGKKFVKSVAKNMGVTEDKAAAMVGGKTAPKSSSPPAAPVTPPPGGKTVPGAGKTVRGAPAGGPPGAPPPATPPTPRLPRQKGKRPSLDILEWMRRRRSGAVSQELARRKFSKLPTGVQAQLDFEAGNLKLLEVRSWLDSRHRLMRKAGIDVGYVENYLTHLWKESPAEVRAKLGKRLGLKPGIAMTRSIPTLAEGIQKGLTPKFENMTDVLAWYDHATNKALADRGFFEWLREQKQIKPAGKAPHNWITLDPDRFPIRKWKGNTVQFKAPRDMAVKINEYLYDIESDPRTFVQGLSKVAKFSSFLKNIRLAAGVPFTKLNMHSFSVMAHHVLSTPTVKGVVPNIPRMIGRGLKDFGEMLDPRLHRWTDAELRQAKLMQKYGPLTLSTEDHVFAPAVRGSLKERLGKAKNIPQAFKTIIDRMFEEPLFQSHLPKMKLNVAWELQRQYRKQGMAKRQAIEAAGEVTNNFFGGLNLDEMGRSKIGQELARVLVLAPDWLESNLKTVKEIAKSPLGRTPKEKTYRDFMVNLMGTYVAGTILQKALTGRWMHENNPGNQFSIYLGKNPKNGKDRYVKPYGAGLAGVRIIYDTAESTVRRQDISRFGEVFRSRMAIPTGSAASLMFNKGPFGQQVLKKGDTLGGQLMSVGEFAAGQVTPQYVMGPVAALKGDISPELGLAQSIEFPYTEVKPRNPDEAVPPTRKRRRRRR